MSEVSEIQRLQAENQKLQEHLDIELRAVMQLSEKLRAAKDSLEALRYSGEQCGCQCCKADAQECVSAIAKLGAA